MFWELAADTWADEERAAINRVLDSGRYTIGPEIAAFEKAFAAYHGKRHAVMVNSGSSANLVAVASLFHKKDRPLQPGDEVIVPAISWATTYHPFQQYGLKLRFVDVELDTLNIDTTQLQAALTPKTKAIVAVSILGNPAALDIMRAFADAHGLTMLEDNCESLDAELNGQKTGTFGDIGTFSFFFSHHISTGEGGMLITDDAELDALARAVRAHGWIRDIPDGLDLFEEGEDSFAEAYRFVIPGYNLRPQEFNGAAGLEQLKKLPAMTERRRANLALFQDAFGDDERFMIQRENGKSSSFCFPMIVKPDCGLERADVFGPLEEADIGFRMITGGNFPRHDAIQYFDYDIVGDLANADIAHDRGFFVGNHPFDLSQQIARLRDVFNKL
ncbi:MAG TPA: DegT/DnrJ/EryC1/StrS family aminotransferase [Rhodospirillales bacterium]|jgi:CDP-6-deoxy-D-xylo-4-hexulose-3-dehydrase|nr:DegT/DnrJ/EryC1/StrS family aminotransferase [Rhodospirillales bacterium]HIE19570.1 DegT/DnrJ/EryC1/StrS family aminotransferase [Rhodospirillales bacterium]HIM24322.1 DegT/DnrJ/EryC1/StrS family aminotransferase [Rhodospirillales bacterium]HIM77739.1 DegT/DnrJ/EryC1/StrS family aminotransferase [Rhodospirillales bacterium]